MTRDASRGDSETTKMSLLDQWGEFQQATGCSPATVSTRRDAVSSLITQSGISDVLQLDRRHVITFLARPTSAWTRLTYYKSLKAFSAFLREFEYTNTDLLRGVPRPRTPEARARPIDDFTVARLLNAELPKRTRAYVILALFGALRVHEIAKVRGEDLDVPSCWLTVTGKGGQTKAIPIHPEIIELSETMPEFGYWFPSAVHPTEHVNPEAVSQTITGALRTVGSKATAHQLRDTAATRIQRMSKDIRITQQVLRHSDIKSTAKYVAVADEDLQAAVRGLQWGRDAA